MPSRGIILCWISMLALVICFGCENSDSESIHEDGDTFSPDGDTLPVDGDGDDEEIEAPEGDPDPEIALPFITDEQGRVLILHGVNVDNHAKSPPYLPAITKEEVLRLSNDWGLNFVRYLILWAGVEPEPGEYDEAYFDQIEERLDWFEEAGIWVLLDMHQDVYSELICGDGAPAWAVEDDGLETECQSKWFLNYFEPGVQRAFDNFWNYDGPHSHLQDHYADMWLAVADRFKNHPSVIGYDIMNEPHPGTMFDAAEAIGLDSPDSPSPEFDRQRLQPFYQRVIDSIRKVDSDNWIAFEPRYGAPGNGSPSWLTAFNDPRPGPQKLIYAPHLYSVGLENNESYNPDIDTTVTDWENYRKQEMQQMGTALVVGEWGLSPYWPNSRLFMREVFEMSDSLLAGWAYWSWDPGGWSWINPDLSERETANDITRVYPQRIAGIPISFSFDADTLEFRLEFTDHPDIEGPTEIYIPASRFYPNGWDLSITDPDSQWSMEWDENREVASISIEKTGNTHIIEIRSTH